MPLNKNKRRKPEGEASSGGGWEIVYSGFVLILLCFFIMLSSFASVEKGKVVRFVKSFVNAVSIFSDGLSLQDGKRVLPKSVELIDKESELADIYGQLKSLAEASGMADELQLSDQKRGLVIRMSETVVFARGDARILPTVKPFLDKVGTLIGKTDHTLRIEGHTDSDPIRTAKYPSNWELSTLRAVQVLRYFIGKGYVSPDHISAVGFSRFKPIAANDSAENKAKNRRVEIILLRGDSADRKGVR